MERQTASLIRAVLRCKSWRTALRLVHLWVMRIDMNMRHTPYGVDGTSLTVDEEFMEAEASHAEALTAIYVDDLPEGGPVDFELEGERAEHDD